MNEQYPILWSPSGHFIRDSNLKRYEKWLHARKELSFASYQEMQEWSVRDPGGFWESLWEYFEVIHHSDYTTPISNTSMPNVRWFEGATLNYAEHIFRKKNDDRPALIYKTERGPAQSESWELLEKHTASIRAFLINEGVQKGDRVAAYLPNIPETIAAFLAVSSIGAVWSCCSPDFGVSTVIDRFSQIEPKIFIAGNGYVYNGKTFSKDDEINEIIRQLPTLKKTVIIPVLPAQAVEKNGRINWNRVLETPSEGLEFEAVEFNHPLWILYSSGTTGKPKAITHSHGGVLLEHLKYLHFHNDVKPGENFFWFTTTGWMMWNFLQASLLAGATAVLYEGSPGHPDLNTLWKFAGELPVHHFGTSAPYLIACMKKGLNPGRDFDFSNLRSIGSTGAPLPPEAFDWVYDSVSKDVWLCSMSGGTDVCTAFVGGCPWYPVRRGLIQAPALGCDLRAYNGNGEPVFGETGEMVIRKPMPSMPVYFWDDDGDERYRESYFEKFEGVWCHGDWIRLYENGNLAIQGRSDATLNRKGIRIGTAEIYRVLDGIEGIRDSLVVNIEKMDGGDWMPLFIVPENGANMSSIEDEIREKLRENCSPRHIPDDVIAVPDIPYTLSGKKMELPVKKILMGMEKGKGINREAVRNPSAIDFFVKIASNGLL